MKFKDMSFPWKSSALSRISGKTPTSCINVLYDHTISSIFIVCRRGIRPFPVDMEYNIVEK
jgi:hypothetical protein